MQIGQVEKFVHAVNLALRQRQDYHQLSLATDRIESYDVIEPPNDECSQVTGTKMINSLQLTLNLHHSRVLKYHKETRYIKLQTRFFPRDKITSIQCANEKRLKMLYCNNEVCSRSSICRMYIVRSSFCLLVKSECKLNMTFKTSFSQIDLNLSNQVD